MKPLVTYLAGFSVAAAPALAALASTTVRDRLVDEVSSALSEFRFSALLGRSRRHVT